MDVELKPCPFCGGKPYMSRKGLSEVHAYADEVKIQCGTCSVYRSAMGDTSKRGYADNSTVEARAIEKWNTRHGAGDAEDLEQFRGAVQYMHSYGSGAHTVEAGKLLKILDERKAARAGERG